jgi:hypothetical protein
MPTQKKFELGQVVMTRGVQRWMEAGFEPIQYLRRHARGDWGDLSDEDKRRNDEAVEKGLRILSSYVTEYGKLWIITEARRHATTLLKPSEY